jgi:hypothetical protein
VGGLNRRRDAKVRVKWDDPESTGEPRGENVHLTDFRDRTVVDCVTGR